MVSASYKILGLNLLFSHINIFCTTSTALLTLITLKNIFNPKHFSSKIAVLMAIFQKQSSRGFLRNFAKFTGKQLRQNHFFNKVAGLATLLKKQLWHRYFPVNFEKFLRTSFLTEHLRWLLLIFLNF